MSKNEQAADKPLQLKIVVASTRPGRIGLPIGEWMVERAAAHGGFEVELVDLAKVNLPMMDEPNHPRLRQYVHEHTKAWSATVEAADAFIFVTPEYNFGMIAPLKNALDYLATEWNGKPVGFVSYGGVSAGLRGVQMAKQVVTTLQMMPVTEAVSIPMVASFFDEQKQFHPNEILETSATALLDALERWTTAMRPLREKAA